MDLGFGPALALQTALAPVAEQLDKLAPEVRPLADTAVVAADLQRPDSALC